MISIILADDHDVVRAGLQAILSPHPDLRIVAEAEDGDGLLAAMREHRPDVVIMDVSMPGPGPFELVDRIVRAGAAAVVLSMRPAEQVGVRLLKAGVAAYLEKSESVDHLVPAIRRAAEGGVYVPPAVGAHMAQLLGAGQSVEEEPHERLSRREFQVLVRLARGLSVKRTAVDLSLSPKTVSTYRARLLEKLGVDSTAELIRYAIERGLVD